MRGAHSLPERPLKAVGTLNVCLLALALGPDFGRSEENKLVIGEPRNNSSNYNNNNNMLHLAASRPGQIEPS